MGTKSLAQCLAPGKNLIDVSGYYSLGWAGGSMEIVHRLRSWLGLPPSHKGGQQGSLISLSSRLLSHGSWAAVMPSHIWTVSKWTIWNKLESR